MSQSKKEEEVEERPDFTASEYLSPSGLFMMRMLFTMISTGHLCWYLSEFNLGDKRDPMVRVAERASLMASFIGLLSHLGSAMACKVPTGKLDEAVLISVEVGLTIQAATFVGKILVSAEVLDIMQHLGLFLLILLNIALTKGLTFK